MKFIHHNFEFELEDAWWTEAGMKNFTPKRKAYRVDKTKAVGIEILEIQIEDISPVKRNSGVSIFNDCSETGKTAHSRTVEILHGFTDDVEIGPVEIYPDSSLSEFQYDLKDGTHRLYYSLDAGFTHVPAIIVERFDCGSRC